MKMSRWVIGAVLAPMAILSFAADRLTAWSEDESEER
jgi:hypothetical protein